MFIQLKVNSSVNIYSICKRVVTSCLLIAIVDIAVFPSAFNQELKFYKSNMS